MQSLVRCSGSQYCLSRCVRAPLNADVALAHHANLMHQDERVRVLNRKLLGVN